MNDEQLQQERERYNSLAKLIKAIQSRLKWCNDIYVKLAANPAQDLAEFNKTVNVPILSELTSKAKSLIAELDRIRRRMSVYSNSV